MIDHYHFFFFDGDTCPSISLTHLSPKSSLGSALPSRDWRYWKANRLPEHHVNSKKKRQVGAAAF
jgi:hypothetical protein